jgi:hypothetical protein
MNAHPVEDEVEVEVERWDALRHQSHMIGAGWEGVFTPFCFYFV